MKSLIADNYLFKASPIYDECSNIEKYNSILRVAYAQISVESPAISYSVML